MPVHPHLPLGENDIDIWLAFYDEITDEGLLADMWKLLTAAERRQQARFHFADDRKRYLVTRGMVRTVLSRYAAVEAAAWNFSVNPYGRPFIEGHAEEAPGLRFNVSHTRGLIALAVARHREIGVDVENIAVRESLADIAEHVFSPTEIAELASTPAERSHDRFFEYWTFKESYIKARGMGLSLALDKFSFLFPREDVVKIVVDPALEDDADRWSFWQYRPTGDYLLALCAEKRAGKTAIVTRKMIPTASDEILETVLLKTSETAM